MKKPLLKNLGDALENVSHSFYDYYVEANVKARQALGVKQQVIRRQVLRCCDWCADLAGIYTYPNVPSDVWARHNNCRCQVTFISERNGTYKDVWSKQEYKTQREARVNRLKEIEELDKFKEKLNLDNLKYISDNTSPAKKSVEELRRIYNADVAAGWVSSLIGFDGYYANYLRIERQIVGRKTSDGIPITGQSVHFMQRVIGTMVDPAVLKKTGKKVRRSGVEISDIEDALFNGIAGPARIDAKTGDISKVYYNRKCKVSINPDTGVLIQCNPRTKKNDNF